MRGILIKYDITIGLWSSTAHLFVLHALGNLLPLAEVANQLKTVGRWNERL